MSRNQQFSIPMCIPCVVCWVEVSSCNYWYIKTHFITSCEETISPHVKLLKFLSSGAYRGFSPSLKNALTFLIPWCYPQPPRCSLSGSHLHISTSSSQRLSSKMQEPFYCLSNLFPEPMLPRWLTSSIAQFFFLCDFLNKLSLVVES